MPNSRSIAFTTGVLLGAAVGTVTGLLLAPRSGNESRRLLKKSAAALPDMAEDLSTSMQIQAQRLSGATAARWDNTLLRLQAAIAAGTEAAKAQRQALQTPRRGA
ncbi:YtxH domain-containing protein [Lyngbya confervoides]|uniref:YtxH domain-containing protein n=1 Tax=Lyngbya confervoides BDU141951 TaxID=1574623 RepID=A0ABD4T2K3_9CYAN|nr:YtxH domain-containing protein [Lyngbya confervoides]MCM1982467.1 YtxH domain-containing protein [Lyngbya confervoides BDU141951]